MGLLIGNVDKSILPNSVISALSEDVPMYGVKFTPSTTAGTRTYDAANLQWTYSSNTVTGTDNFKSLAPFNTKECCRIWDSSTSTASYVYKDDYTDSEWETIRQGTHNTISGDIMIEVPEFWYKRIRTSDQGLEIIVAPEYKEGFSPDPWHYRQGTHYSTRHYSKYMINSDYTSLSGKTPLASTNMNTFRTNLASKGLYMVTAPAYYSMLMLMLVKYANLNGQTTVGYGKSSGSAVGTTGTTDSVLGVDGSATSVSTSESVLCMGIEDFYGNAWKYLDGLYSYNGNLYIRDVEDMTTDPSSSSDLSNYTKISSSHPTSGSFTGIANVIYNDEYDYLFTPTTVSTDNTILATTTFDNYWSASALDCCVVGGSAWAGDVVGFFAFASNHMVGYTAADYGCSATD